ncbi:PAS domain S-box protein [Lacinutrix neustonica]|uniref:PAS domain S-box protein n=1 Tax=Lacinutrix neustonica TaxID=2980107 RepID=A0A9E8MVM5_9FLAO|nr:PAS domain S-box protein [Lacinutrix neustonica]WAC01452.1 PAS domain S-box protein [Lacinutrix neustonica]
MNLSTDVLFENIFSHAHGGIAIVNAEGRWIKVNQSIIDLFGYSEKELYQLSFQDITHRDDLDLDLGPMHQLLEGKTEKYQIEKCYFHKKGHVIVALL